MKNRFKAYYPIVFRILKWVVLLTIFGFAIYQFSGNDRFGL